MDLKTDKLKDVENAKLRLVYFDMQIRQAAERAEYHATERKVYETIENSYRDDLKRVYDQIGLDVLEGRTYHFRYYEPILEKLDAGCQMYTKKVNNAKEETKQALRIKNNYEELKNEFLKLQKLKWNNF